MPTSLVSKCDSGFIQIATGILIRRPVCLFRSHGYTNPALLCPCFICLAMSPEAPQPHSEIFSILRLPAASAVPAPAAAARHPAAATAAVSGPTALTDGPDRACKGQECGQVATDPDAVASSC